MSKPKTEEELREWLQQLAGLLADELPPQTTFVVLIFYGGDRLNYIANARRTDVVRVMREFITMTEGRFGEHIGESDEDAEVAQLRQRVEVLQLKQKRFFTAGFGLGRNLNWDVEEAWKMYLESVGDQ